MPTVHGLVVVHDGRLQLCLNEFAQKIELFRKSQLVLNFGRAVLDPPALEASGEAISLRSGISRKNDEDILDELYRQTGNRYVTVRLKRHSASIAVSPGDAMRGNRPSR